MMPEPPCSLRRDLSYAVTVAVKATYFARDAYNLAVKEKRNTGASAVALVVARKAERDAVRHPDNHRKEHHC